MAKSLNKLTVIWTTEYLTLWIIWASLDFWAAPGCNTFVQSTSLSTAIKIWSIAVSQELRAQLLTPTTNCA